MTRSLHVRCYFLLNFTRSFDVKVEMLLLKEIYIKLKPEAPESYFKGKRHF